ncbi:MAG: calcineurin-like phosphoesterase C-terminal domain-containing protein [Alistipes sp.]|nr:calcineurin-like phosphoesterase C-terminal domain-containing protein [Alistipes sp.]
MKKLRYLFAVILLFTVNISVAQEPDNTGFNLIVLGDTQPQTEEQLARFENEIMPSIASILAEYDHEDSIPEAILITGDIVWDTMEFLPRIKAMFEPFGVPLLTVPGNHDYDRKIEGRERRALRDYCHTFGKRYYATELGGYTLIGLDNILYNNYFDYSLGIDRKQLRWLKRALQRTPQDRPLLIAMHAPAYDARKGIAIPYAQEIFDLVGNREVHLLTGHGHRNNTFDIAPNIIEHCVAQVNGNLWFAPICADGTPRGVLIVEGRNDDIRWHFRTLEHSAEHQMVAWREEEVKDNEEYVVVKIWGVDSKWSVQCSEDGTTWHDMEPIIIVDPEYINYVENEASYPEIIMERLRRSAIPAKHFFRYKRSTQDNAVTIKSTDRFGRTYELVIP